METKKISLLSFILPLIKPILFFLVLFIFASILCFDLYLNNLLNWYDYIVFSTLILVTIVPSIILQVNYYLFDKDTLFEIDEIKNELCMRIRSRKPQIQLFLIR